MSIIAFSLTHTKWLTLRPDATSFINTLMRCQLAGILKSCRAIDNETMYLICELKKACIICSIIASRKNVRAVVQWG